MKKKRIFTWQSNLQLILKTHWIYPLTLSTYSINSFSPIIPSSKSALISIWPFLFILLKEALKDNFYSKRIKIATSRTISLSNFQEKSLSNGLTSEICLSLLYYVRNFSVTGLFLIDYYCSSSSIICLLQARPK